MKLWGALGYVIGAVFVAVGACMAYGASLRHEAPACLKSHQQIIIVWRACSVNDNQDMYSTAVVAEVCDKAALPMPDTIR